jgi:hypothetical protein
MPNAFWPARGAVQHCAQPSDGCRFLLLRACPPPGGKQTRGLPQWWHCLGTCAQLLLQGIGLLLTLLQALCCCFTAAAAWRSPPAAD